MEFSNVALHHGLGQGANQSVEKRVYDKVQRNYRARVSVTFHGRNRIIFSSFLRDLKRDIISFWIEINY